MRLNRGLSVLALSVFFLNSVGNAAGPEVVRRGGADVAVGHVKTTAEIDRWVSNLSVEERAKLNKALGADLAKGGVDAETANRYKRSLETLEKAKPEDRAAAEREYHAAIHEVLKEGTFIAKGGEVTGGEVATLLKDPKFSAGLQLRNGAVDKRVQFGTDLFKAVNGDMNIYKAMQDFHAEMNTETATEGSRTGRTGVDENAETDNQKTLLFLANKIGEVRSANGIVKGVGEAEKAEGKIPEAEKEKTAETLKSTMDVEFAAGNTGKKALATAEGLVNLLTGKDPISRADALAGVKLLHDTFANKLRNDLNDLATKGVKGISEIEGLSVDKAKVAKALKGIKTTKADGSPRSLSELLSEVRERLKKEGLRESEVEQVIEALRERAGKEVIKLIAENKNLDAAGKRELICGVPSEGRPSCVSEQMAPAKALRAMQGILSAAGINAEQCIRDRAATSGTNNLRRGVNPSGPATKVAPATRGGTHDAGGPDLPN